MVHYLKFNFFTGLICRDDQFMCASQDECIDIELACNESNDCIDESDEDNCPPGTLTICKPILCV